MSATDQTPPDWEAEAPLREASAWCLRMADGDLSTAEEAEFRAWCERDARNLPAFETVERAWRIVGQGASAPAMLGMRRAALDDLYRARAFRWRKSPRAGVLAVAACVLALVGGMFVLLAGQPKVYQTAVGERRVITLADSSRISLDGATKVRVLYGGGRRQFWLDNGRAKFSVAKDPLRPFTVTAGHEMVVATGTQFSVELLRDQVRVALYEGHVTVWRANNTSGPLQPVMAGAKIADQSLTPGRTLVARADATDGRLMDDNPAHSLSWETGQLVFENEPLALAVERINRYLDHPLRVTEDAGREIRISGVFTAGDEDAFVQAVVSLFPLRAVRAGETVTLETEPGRPGDRPRDAAPLG